MTSRSPKIASNVGMGVGVIFALCILQVIWYIVLFPFLFLVGIVSQRIYVLRYLLGYTLLDAPSAITIAIAIWMIVRRRGRMLAFAIFAYAILAMLFMVWLNVLDVAPVRDL